MNVTWVCKTFHVLIDFLFPEKNKIFRVRVGSEESCPISEWLREFLLVEVIRIKEITNKLVLSII